MSGSDALPLITKVWLISQEVEDKEVQRRGGKGDFFCVFVSLVSY